MSEFFSMGGYAAYVWPSYILTAMIMLVLLVVSVRSLKSTETTFKRLKAEVGPTERGPANSQSSSNVQESAHGDEA